MSPRPLRRHAIRVHDFRGLQRDLDQSADRLGARERLALPGQPVIDGSQLVRRQPDPDLRRALALAAPRASGGRFFFINS